MKSSLKIANSVSSAVDKPDKREYMAAINRRHFIVGDILFYVVILFSSTSSLAVKNSARIDVGIYGLSTFVQITGR